MSESFSWLPKQVSCVLAPLFPLTVSQSLGRNTRPTPGTLFSSPQPLSPWGQWPCIPPSPSVHGTSSALTTIADSKVRGILQGQRYMCTSAGHTITPMCPALQGILSPYAPSSKEDTVILCAHIYREYCHPHVPSSVGDAITPHQGLWETLSPHTLVLILTLSQSTFSTSTRIRMSSGMARAGWVSFS